MEEKRKMGNGKQGRVLIVAGSDSGGGAGIQADIKSVTAMGGFAMTAVTAITVQNTLGVSAIHEVPLDIVVGQMRAVLEDLGADAVKTGMLHNAEIVEAVAEELSREESAPLLVADPVMIAKGGASLLEDRLFPRSRKSSFRCRRSSHRMFPKRRS